MLNDLLRLLGDGGIHSTAELARRLGVSEALLATMTGDLTRRGYLAPVDTGCGTSCDGCGVARTCAPAAGNAPAPMLMLTAKGAAVFDRQKISDVSSDVYEMSAGAVP